MKDITEAALASKALRCMLAALIALASALGTLGVQGKSAYAAESANLTTGGKIHYGGYHTTWMEADGEMAYCADPQSATPSPGSYAKSSIDAPSGRNARWWRTSGSPTGAPASMRAYGRTSGTTAPR
ncbi:thioester domain-containing protein [Eggerthella sinensis]|uniref:thioester domain-containing protein n=1 Tax=Eggerthella sinensis TaxID=242230 RepID=UPI0022E695E3|nr:thioester domain-containing protein [Eggerthella sinensis]